MIYVLEKCGDNLTRENVMKVATSLKNVQLDLSLPGIVANTTPDDYRVNKQLQMMKFNGGALGTVRPDPRGRRPVG